MKQVLLVTLIAVFATSMMVQQQVQAGQSIIGRISDGYDAGKAQGKQDYRQGNGWNDNCPYGVGVQYCIGWVSGYNVGYGSLKVAGD